MISKSVLAAVVALASMCLHNPAALGQPPVRCQPPEPSGDCREWALTGKAYDVTLSTKIEKVRTSQHKGGWVVVDACNCFWAPCGDSRFRPCPSVEFQFSREEQICWKISGSITAEAKTGLLENLLAELNVTVEVGGEFQKCVSTSTALTFPVTPSDCWRHKSRDVWTEDVVQGVTIEAETVFYWDCLRPNGMVVTWGTYCNPHEAKGEVPVVSSRLVQNAPYPPCAGGPNPTPPEYDGQLAIQCCTPHAPCDTYPPEEHDCCGCYGNTN